MGFTGKNARFVGILFDRFKPSAYLCVIVIARESESEPVVHHNREIGKH